MGVRLTNLVRFDGGIIVSRTVHMCLSVRGALRSNSTIRALRGCITLEDGRKAETVEAVREFLFDQLAQGHEVIPFGSGCDGFDWKNGCPGHENVEQTESACSATPSSPKSPSGSAGDSSKAPNERN